MKFEKRINLDGYPFSIEILRLETETTWTLEVVDHEGNSHVWEEQFTSETEARNAAINALETEGALAFMPGKRHSIPSTVKRRGLGHRLRPNVPRRAKPLE